MMDNREAKILTEKFFNGETTIEEEKRLYRYFSSSDVDKELLPLKQMFLDFSDLHLEDSIQQNTDKNTMKWRKNGWLSIAAAVAVMLIIAGVGFFSYHDNDECEMMVYGKQITDKNVVMSEVKQNINNMSKTMPKVDNELKDAFGM